MITAVGKVLIAVGVLMMAYAWLRTLLMPHHMGMGMGTWSSLTVLTLGAGAIVAGLLSRR